MRKLNIGIVACSNVAVKRFIPALLKSKNANLYIIGSRYLEKAQKIADQFNCANYGTYNDVLINKDVDMVYISTPITLREELTVTAIKNNKHVICEKPAFTIFKTASRLAAMSKKYNVRILDGWSFKYHKQHEIVKNLIENDTIGEIKNFVGQFTYPHPGPRDIRLNPELCGGVFFDSAGYPVVASRLFIDSKPVSVYCTRHINEKYSVDDYVSLQIQYGKDINAIGIAGFGLHYNSTYSITGTRGRISVLRAYAVPDNMETNITIETNEGIDKIKVPPQNQFLSMIDAFCAQIIDESSSIYNSDNELLMHHSIMDVAFTSSIKNKPNSFDSVCPEHLN